ncbi:MAG: hypothetical protein KJI72_00645 [Patescibacteria group bacterium]|nr:hypothetical protein [Patescibacteria group bacterium]
MDELKLIYDEDQKDRKEKLWERDSKLFVKRDKIRLERILQLIKENKLRSPADYLHAAMILQHGKETKHYELAHEFAKRAADKGYTPQKGEVDPLWLSAAAKDRALMSQGKPQLYGTQFRKKSPDGPWHLYEVDPTVTDEERAKLHVPPLITAKKWTEESNKSENEKK